MWPLTFCKTRFFLQKCLIWRLSLTRGVSFDAFGCCSLFLFTFVYFFTFVSSLFSRLCVCMCVFWFCSIFKTKSAFKSLVSFCFNRFVCFYLLHFFFVFFCLMLFFHLTFYFTIPYFDKEIDNHSKADFFRFKLFSACWHNCLPNMASFDSLRVVTRSGARDLFDFQVGVLRWKYSNFRFSL